MKAITDYNLCTTFISVCIAFLKHKHWGSNMQISEFPRLLWWLTWLRCWSIHGEFLCVLQQSWSSPLVASRHLPAQCTNINLKKFRGPIFNLLSFSSKSLFIVTSPKASLWGTFRTNRKKLFNFSGTKIIRTHF